MMSSTEYLSKLNTLTGLAYSAAMDPTKWQVFVDVASQSFNRLGTHMFGHDSIANVSQSVIWSGYDEEHTENFEQYYATINEWAPGFMEHEVGQVIHTEHMKPVKELLKTEFYAGWCMPQGDLRTGGGVILYKDDNRMYCLGGNIRRADSDKLDALWLRFLNDIQQHVRQALAINRSFMGMAIEKHALVATGGELDTAIFAVGQSGRLLHLNTPGYELNSKARIIQESASGAVSFRNPELQNAYRRVCSPRIEDCGYFANPIVVALDGQHYECRFIRYKVAQDSVEGELYSFLGDQCKVILAMSCPRGFAFYRDKIQEKLNLSPKEAEVALELASGRTVKDIAHKYHKSVYTVKDQLKSIARKTGVGRQKDLVALVCQVKDA